MSEKRRTDFGCLNRTAEILMKSGDLPHWFQPGAAMFITFRTLDSMPAGVIERWRIELELWLKARGLPPALATPVTDQERLDAAALEGLQPEHRREFQRQRNRLWHRSLDEGHGECLLRNPEIAAIVARAMQFYDDEKYDVDCFVIMPNHVHAIIQFRSGSSLDVISQSWLRYTARQINGRTNRTGDFWQGEPFDHLIRSPEQFDYLRRYIAENPRKAKLNDAEFLYWQR